MKKTKKILSLLLAGLLTVSVAACGQQAVTNDQGSSETSSDLSSETTGEKPSEPTGQLVIGSTSQVINEFL